MAVEVANPGFVPVYLEGPECAELEVGQLLEIGDIQGRIIEVLPMAKVWISTKV